ncbi:hypothetical protein CSQ92_27925 [Janthinobacterium sp. BJB446]|uniref:PFGI-1 class ICE element type IV pilus protein PilL2 n=1 Tax=Janthinobacterium sp. BJB446 TaxID=2048009 RepID=UPI000C0F8B34|nr:hypothetical protein [Janthinobacterium sp. BJB446]PHV19206.1 hypothetical protein CSQ92_27925 [Janthinobacterium sp. BJB446]
MHQRPGVFNSVLIALLLVTGNALADTPMRSAAADAENSLQGRMARQSSDGETLINRYTAISLQPSAADIDPMRIVAQVNFPRMNTKTVGEAIRYLLIRTGYDLVDESQLDPQVVALLAKRLPDSQRTLGPYHVDTMLTILIGPAFKLSMDHASRRISFRPAVPSDATATAPGTIAQRSKPDASIASDETGD